MKLMRHYWNDKDKKTQTLWKLNNLTITTRGVDEF